MNILSDWYTYVGAAVVLLLGLLKLREYQRKRVALQINLEKKLFFCERWEDRGVSNTTCLELVADLRNTGLEPTTVSGVRLTSNISDLDNQRLELLDTPTGLRLDANDRKRLCLRMRLPGIVLSDEVLAVDAVFHFETSHGDKKCSLRIRRDPTHEYRQDGCGGFERIA